MKLHLSEGPEPDVQYMLREQVETRLALRPLCFPQEPAVRSADKLAAWGGVTVTGHRMGWGYSEDCGRGVKSGEGQGSQVRKAVRPAARARHSIALKCKR